MCSKQFIQFYSICGLFKPKMIRIRVTDATCVEIFYFCFILAKDE